MLLIDPPAWPAHGRLWSHLVSTTSYAELHAFAERAGISRRAFEGDHYDIPEERHAAVVAAGATPVQGRELLLALRDSGLRIPKRTRERVVHSTTNPVWLPPGSRADVIASRQVDAPPRTVVVRAVISSGRGMLVVSRPDGAGHDLPTRSVAEGESARQALESLGADLGIGLGDATLVGYVRNVVPAPDRGYPWPAPTACFAVFALSVGGSGPATGTWCPPERQEAELGERHWWPLVRPGLWSGAH
ncbi:DUF4031 domain-containing protein [Knoellia sp. Soil729]|uniref:DUF4031 domain-containing protein n=1 Tax=Knoellia sp. Soil729 TaxID=1736394 RepID=UPI0009EC1B98|nr:DUF4031 domain-containing protein [Knoellia sp. Soil729]